MKKTYLLIFISTCYFIIAQNREMPINIQSPNASSLGKYGDLSMNLSTGRANVSVPVYQLEEGGIPMDISMSYDTGGVRVNDVPGWVGQNWALQAGGVVTRSVRGKAADEMNWKTSESGFWYDWKGYFYYKDILNTGNWNSEQYLSNLANDALHFPDYEPDVFTFNFLGFSGKFFLGSDGEWKVSSASNLKVVIDINDKVQPNNYDYIAHNNHNNRYFPKVLGKITIIDEQGNKYIFGDLVNQNSIEFTFQDFFNQINTPLISSAWYLTKVYDRYDKLIYDLDYDRGDYIASFYDRNGFQALKLTTGYYAGGSCVYGSNDVTNVYANGNLIIPSYLKKITTSSYKQIFFNSSTNSSLKYGSNDSPIIDTFIKFRQDIQATQSNWSQIDDKYFYYIRRDQNLNVLTTVTGGNEHIYPYLEALKWRKLTSLSIVSSDQNTLLTAAFSYNDNPNSRLRLDRISINNIDSKTPQVYSFEYNNFDSLPLFTSKNIDHFGYYKSTPFVLNYENPSVHEPSRATDPNTVTFGTLSKITYPTKGYTKLFYEPHSYSKYVGNDLYLKQENGIIGGVRIRSIFDYDGITVPQIRKFSYVTDQQSNQSSGILLQKNNYFLPDYKVPTTASGVTMYKSYFSISPIVYLSNLMGNTIEYSTVIEDNGKGTIFNHYSTYSDYSDFKNDTYIANDKNKFDPHTEYMYKRGKITQKQYFDKIGSKVRQEDFSYEDSYNQSVRGFSYTSIAPCAGVSNAPIVNGSSYNIYFSDFEKRSQKITNYFSGGNSIEEFETYNYAKSGNFGDNFLTSKITTNPDKSTEETFTYPFQVNNPVNNKLVESHNFPIIQKDKYANSKNISKRQIPYEFMPVADQSSTILAPSYQNNIDINTQLYYNNIKYDLYDSVGNLVQYTPQNNVPTTLIWGYNKTRIIAKIEGATYSQVKPLINDIVTSSNQSMINSTYGNNLDSKLNIFRTNASLKDYQITVYTYFKGGVGLKSVTNASGQTEKYIYDSRNRLQKILDNNNNIVNEWDYNYSPTTVQNIFFNGEKNIPFTRNNCGINQIGSTYMYNVPDGKYSSIVSQADADQKAQNDIDTNGQNTANKNGSCRPVVSCYVSTSPFSGGGGVIETDINYKATVSFNTGSNSINLPWMTGVKIGTIQGICKPLTDYNSYNGQMYYTITTNGDIIVKSHSGNYPNNKSYNNLLFYFPKN